MGRYGRVPIHNLNALPLTRFSPAAARRGKGGPEAIPAGRGAPFRRLAAGGTLIRVGSGSRVPRG
jgi:hypothetical protein